MTPKEKRQSRIIALQVIYAYELEGSEIDETCKYLMESDIIISREMINYSKMLSTLIKKHTVKIDELIKARSINWDFNRITLIDKLILRMALVEMIYIEEIPPKVSIAESVEIAKQFSTEDSSSFINGILDSVYNELIMKKEKII